jgi:hypothetical protein
LQVLHLSARLDELRDERRIQRHGREISFVGRLVDDGPRINETLDQPTRRFRSPVRPWRPGRFQKQRYARAHRAALAALVEGDLGGEWGRMSPLMSNDRHSSHSLPLVGFAGRVSKFVVGQSVQFLHQCQVWRQWALHGRSPRQPSAETPRGVAGPCRPAKRPTPAAPTRRLG